MMGFLDYNNLGFCTLSFLQIQLNNPKCPKTVETHHHSHTLPIISTSISKLDHIAHSQAKYKYLQIIILKFKLTLEHNIHHRKVNLYL